MSWLRLIGPMLAVEPCRRMFGELDILAGSIGGISLGSRKNRREVGNLQRRIKGLPRWSLAALSRVDCPDRLELPRARLYLN